MNANARVFARRVRSLLLPVRSLLKHLQGHVHRTGKDLDFEDSVIQAIETDVIATLREMGINQ